MGMLKVMLVDSKMTEIDRLSGLVDWQGLGYTVVAKVTRSVSVIDMVLDYEPELILIELKMPVIDGLELCRRIRRLDTDVKIVALASASDPLAAVAINIGVNGYIEKEHLDKYSLNSQLTRLREDIDRNRKVQSIIKKYSINEMIRRHSTVECWSSNLIGGFQIFCKAAVMVVKLDTPYNFWYNIPEDYDMPVIDLFPWDEVAVMKGIKLLSAVEEESDKWTLVFGIDRNYNGHQIENRLDQISSKLQSWFIDSLDKTVSIARLVTENGLDDLPKIHNNAMELLKYTVFCNRSTVIKDLQLLDKVDKRPVNIRTYISGIHDAVLNEDVEKITEYIHALVNMAIEPSWNLTALRKVCLRLVHVIDYFRVDYGVRTLDEILYEDRRVNDGLYTVKTIEDFFVAEYDKLLSIIREHKNARFSLNVDQCIHYIYKNYDKCTDINVISGFIGVSSVYLGQLFKKEVGCTFTAFLTRYRIEKAKFMLKNDKQKIYEIAQEVGFSSSQYFSRVFYRETGQSPTEFKIDAVCNSRRKKENIIKKTDRTDQGNLGNDCYSVGDVESVNSSR